MEENHSMGMDTVGVSEMSCSVYTSRNNVYYGNNYFLWLSFIYFLVFIFFRVWGLFFLCFTPFPIP